MLDRQDERVLEQGLGFLVAAPAPQDQALGVERLSDDPRVPLGFGRPQGALGPPKGDVELAPEEMQACGLGHKGGHVLVRLGFRQQRQGGIHQLDRLIKPA